MGADVRILFKRNAMCHEWNISLSLSCEEKKVGVGRW